MKFTDVILFAQPRVSGQEAHVLAQLAFVDGDATALVRFGTRQQAWDRACAEQLVAAARQQADCHVVSVRGRLEGPAARC